MGQIWEIHNFCRRETLGAGAKLGEFFFDRHYEIVSLLARPPLPQPIAAKLCAGTSRNKGSLFALSTELLDIIFDLCALQALISLAATCKYLLWVAQKHILDEFSCWAGCRIICLGEYTTPPDFPPNLLTDAEKSLIAASKRDGAHASASSEPDYPVPGLGDFAVTGPRKLNLYTRFGRRCTEEDAERCSAIADMEYGDRKDWLVCNTTKGEYVRAQAVAELNKRPDADQPFLQSCPTTLGHVVLSRICWSIDSSIAMDYVYEGGLHRGVWAGDRFQIITMDRLPVLRGGKRWIDVSDAVCAELLAIWKSDYKERWDYENWCSASDDDSD